MVSNSSVWTDNSMADRKSRRALILQMAKLRMKSGASKATSPSGVDSSKSDLDDPVVPVAESGEELDFNQELD